MIPSYITKTADEIRHSLLELGYHSKVERRSRRFVSMSIQRAEATIRISVVSYEPSIWFDYQSTCMDGLDLGYCIIKKRRGIWSCGCGAADCNTPSYPTRRKLLNDLFIKPVLDVFHKVGQGDYLDFYFDKAYEGVTTAQFRSFGRNFMRGYEPSASIWVAPQKSELEQSVPE